MYCWCDFSSKAQRTHESRPAYYRICRCWYLQTRQTTISSLCRCSSMHRTGRWKYLSRIQRCHHCESLLALLRNSRQSKVQRKWRHQKTCCSGQSTSFRAGVPWRCGDASSWSVHVHIECSGPRLFIDELACSSLTRNISES